MGYNSPQQIMEFTAEAGVKKAQLTWLSLILLGFLGGAFISLGFLLDIRVIGTAPKEWGSIAGFIGASVFPLGLVLIILAGGELLTGNMMTMSMAWFARKIRLYDVLRNWIVVLIMNFVGAIFVAFFFGHVVGLTEGDFLMKTLAIAQAKVKDGFMESFISAIGCNWLVCLSIWIANGSKDSLGKFAGVWFPVMAFVAIGFQHVVANMFVIPAAIFAGNLTWGDYLSNFVPVLLGNIVGGAVFVSLIYFGAYRNKREAASVMNRAA